VCFGQVGVVEMNGVCPDIQGDAGFAALGDKTHDALFANFEAMTAFQHSVSAEAVGGSQDGKAFLLIQQKYTHMVKIKGSADQVRNLR
jgi:hypothetical protein